MIRDVLSPGAVKKTGFFNPSYVDRLLRDHEERNADHSRNIWELLIFHLWYEAYMP